MILLDIIVVYFSILQKANGANILAIHSMGRYSHFQTIFPLVEALARRNHQVTFLYSYPYNISVTNCNPVFVPGGSDFLKQNNNNLFFMDGLGAASNLLLEYEVGVRVTETFLTSSAVKKILESNTKFDLVLIAYFYNEALTGMAHHFHAPVILISPVGESFRINHLTENPAPSSYVPNIHTSFSPSMNFWQKLENLFYNNFFELLNEYWYMPKQRAMYKKYFKNNIVSNKQLYNISMILTVSHLVLHYPVPLKPWVTDIGTYHIRKNQKLPKTVQEYLDKAESGVVVFSLGSILKSKDLPPKVLTRLMRMFSRLPQKILWKLESPLENLPNNVKIFNWIPQQEVLSHRNVRLTIQHCGLLSLMETVYYGVPLIGIPVFSDQMYNTEGAVNNGYAVKIRLDELGSENMFSKIKEISNNQTFNRNAKKYSQIIRDQIIDPTDLAVYWTEYVIRHRGIPYLRHRSLKMEWYQTYILDVFGIIALTIAIAFGITILICKMSSQKKK